MTHPTPKASTTTLLLSQGLGMTVEPYKWENSLLISINKIKISKTKPRPSFTADLLQILRQKYNTGNAFNTKLSF